MIALIIEVTALTRSSYTEDYDELFNQVEYTQPKKHKQKVMIEQYTIELLHKLLLYFWRNYFRHVYSSGDESELAIRKQIHDHKKKKEKTFIEYENFCKFSHLLLILIVRNNKQAL